ncbi:MAG: hypothetical protein Q7J68_06950 [Thermoplasmata archaeon]|nr:hypothetical protein [Thermoplasmata archaeon]
MSRRNKKKFKREQAKAEETVETVETEELEGAFEEEVVETVETEELEDASEEEEMQSEEAEEEFDEYEEDEISSETLKINHKLLILGMMLSLAGLIGVIGLRLGFIQGLLGDPTPYPGIGSVEPSGHIVSLIPFILGLVTVSFWGIKNDPIYYEIEKLKEEESELEDDSEEEFEEEELTEEDIPEEFTEPMADLEEALNSDESIEPEQEYEEISPEEEGPQMTSTALKDELAEELRVERCVKMLTAVVVLPDDKAKLREIIATGIAMHDFIEEVKMAIERRKRREAEKDVTADEKASILEDELVAELAELEDELDNGEEDLEDQILKEIEDLEDL